MDTIYAYVSETKRVGIEKINDFAVRIFVEQKLDPAKFSHISDTFHWVSTGIIYEDTHYDISNLDKIVEAIQKFKKLLLLE